MHVSQEVATVLHDVIEAELGDYLENRLTESGSIAVFSRCCMTAVDSSLRIDNTF